MNKTRIVIIGVLVLVIAAVLLIVVRAGTGVKASSDEKTQTSDTDAIGDDTTASEKDKDDTGTAVTSEDIDSADFPQTGEALKDALSDEHLENINEELPIRVEMWIDQMGYRAEADVTDEETILKIVKAFSQIVVGEQTQEVVTDNYNGVIFYFEDGTSSYVSLNMKNLEYSISNEYQYNELENFDEFWNLMQELTEYEKQSS